MEASTPLDQVREVLESDTPEITAEGEITRRLNCLSKLLLVDYENHPFFDIDTDALFDEIRQSAPRQVCQHAFRKNDIVWICKNCQKDETCVLCNACFNDSDHAGHEVFFYHSQAGGCCDCGDPDAWQSSGFCTKHGHVIENLMDYLPPRSRDIGVQLMDMIADTLTRYCLNCIQQYQLTRFAGTRLAEPLVLVVHLDDSHSPGQLVKHFLDATRTLFTSADELMENVRTMGMLSLELTNQEDAIRIAQVLARQSLVVRLVSHWEFRQEMLLQGVILWLYKVAQASDGFCRMVCNAFTVERVSKMMRADCRLPKRVAGQLHDLFLTLMADQMFKMCVAQAYARSFEIFTKDYATCIGTHEMSLYTLSVQFLNRGTFVNEIVDNHMFLQSLCSALKDMLGSVMPRADQARVFGAEHPVLVFRRYNPIIGDLKCIFTIPGISRVFMSACLPQWLASLAIIQYMHPQERIRTQHVEYETREWMNAFNLYLGLSSVFDSLTNWFGMDDADVSVAHPRGHLPSVSEVAMQTCAALQAWQQQFLNDQVNYVIRVLPGELPIYPTPQKLSFHLILHRMLAAMVREVCKYAAHSSVLELLLRELGEKNEQFMLTMDLPLSNIVWAAQIKLGMWKRNGQVMADQVLNYSDPPFCRVFRDLDVVAVQLCSLRLEPHSLLRHILFRFGVEQFALNNTVDVSADSTCATSLLEEALGFIAMFLTELPPCPTLDISDRVIPLLRREIVHKLVGGPATYSQLQECLTMVPEYEKLPSEAFDQLIDELADSREGLDLGPRTYHLRDEHWALYEPTFPHIHSHTHQTAVEHRPKLTKAAAMVPPPMEVHPMFADLRVQLLSCSAMVDLLRNMLAKFVAQQPSSTQLYDVPRSWPTSCTPTTLVRVIHLITLQLHMLESLVPSTASTQIKQDYYTRVLDGSSGPAIASEDLSEAAYEMVMTESAPQLPSLVCCLLDLYDLLTTKEDANTKYWVRWLLDSMRHADGRCGAFISDRWNLEELVSKASALEAKKKRAKNRALKAVKASAAAFAAQAADFNLSDEDTPQGTPRQGEAELGDEEEPVCIICQDRNGGDIGYIALAQGSRVLNPHHGPFRVDESPPTYESPTDIHYQFCGHAIHFSCFAPYFVSVVNKSLQQLAPIIDTSLREFQCPLCKGLSNTLVPHTPAYHRSRKRSRTANDASTWLERSLQARRESADDSHASFFELENDSAACEVRDWSSSPLATQPVPITAAQLAQHSETKEASSAPEREIQAPISPPESEFSRPRFRSFGSNGSGRSIRSTFSRILTAPFRPRSVSVDNTAPAVNVTEQRRSKWLNFVGEACSPRLGSDPATEERLGDYVQTLCSAIAFTVCAEEAEEGLGHHLDAAFDRRDPYKLISKLVDAVGETLNEFDIAVPLWRMIHHKFEHGSLRSSPEYMLGPRWTWQTEQPLLMSNALDLLVLCLSFRAAVDDDIAFNIARELCMIYFAQLCFGELHASQRTDSNSSQPMDQVHESWAQAEAQQCLLGMRELYGIVFVACPKDNSSLVEPSDTVLQHISFKWVIFMRAVAQLLHRCRPGAISAASPTRPPNALSTSWDDLVLHAALLALPLPRAELASGLQNTAQTVYRTKLHAWLQDLEQDPQKWQTSARQAAWHYPADTRPQLIELPDEYTRLHGELFGMSRVDYPALCLACGSVLDAGGKGRCTDHVAQCSAGNGMVFLLQDCSVLLFHGAGACYVPSPYVDDHGERRRHFRGKPLFLDPRRYELLRQMWASHSVAREVITKRSSSNRVIITNHY